MPSRVEDQPATPQHIPAWKKLGLKLKYAKEEAPSPVSVTPNSTEKKKRKSGPSEDDAKTTEPGSEPDHVKTETTKKSKRRKLSPSDENDEGSAQQEKPTKNFKLIEVSEQSTAEADASEEKSKKKSKKDRKEKKDKILKSTEPLASSETQPEGTTAEASTPLRNPKLKRQKSVTFTPDTKTADGDSAQQMFKAWASSQQGSGEDFTPEEVSQFTPPPKVHPANLEATSDGSKQPSKQDIKQAKKQEKQQRKAEEAAKTAGDLPPYLQYLQQYHTDRPNWKFNKARQTDLLKNIFNIFRIPTTHDDALEAYIAGLQGAAARFRLHEQAQEVLEETSEVASSMNTAEARKAAYEAALRADLRKEKKRMREEEQDEEFRLKQRKRLRAERILAALGDVAPLPNPDASQKTVASASAQANQDAATVGMEKRVRNRKKRVTADDDSSSSSDSSDSSDDEEIPSPANSDDDASDDESSSAVSSSSEDPSSDSSDGESGSGSDGSGDEDESSSDSSSSSSESSDSDDD
ncbi:hypothetical protein K490DRAFT_63392 [Saccharata proteae CBS 121410]|uniref:WKF domain-containing protein n=1 Tax=Saccharata proteae CBS 121410 TaxID=1314787 RepID=A0A6A5YEM3_9PEZI|nr:hypothetical protein K490DRAFT_63392 [Saccharata proteae CBS 121410]